MIVAAFGLRKLQLPQAHRRSRARSDHHPRDTNHDGRFDKRTVFYDKLNYVTGVEVGFGGAG